MSTVIRAFSFEENYVQVDESGDTLSYNRPAARHFTGKGKLHVTFVGGETYTYYNVPREVYEALQDASSKGNFFYYNIRSNYSYTR